MAANQRRLSVWGWLCVVALVFALAGFLTSQLIRDAHMHHQSMWQKFHDNATRYVTGKGGAYSERQYIQVFPYPRVNPKCLPYLDTLEGAEMSREVTVAYSEVQSAVQRTMVLYVLAIVFFSVPVLRWIIKGLAHAAVRSTKSTLGAANKVIDTAYETHAAKMKNAKEKIENDADGG